MNRNIKIALRILTTVIVGVVLFFALSVSAIRLFGFEVYGVLTGSMEPKYPTGSLIYVKKIDTSSLDVGDVISFKLSSSVIATHRIVELVADENNPSVIQYRTKGDANDTVDSSLVSKEDIIGKVVFCIPQMGYFMDYIQSPTGVFVTVMVSIGLVLLVFVAEIITGDDKIMVRWRAKFLGQDPDRMPPRYDDRSMPRRGDYGYDDRRPPQRGRAPQRPEYYDDRRRPQRSRYDDEYRAPRQRSAYNDDYYAPRSRQPQRSNYDDPYRAPRRSSAQGGYDGGYRSQRSGYESSARRPQRNPYDGGARMERRPQQRSGYEKEYRSPRARSSQYGESAYRSRNVQSAPRQNTRTNDRYDDYR